jgi:3-oxoacyl-(acyl-carrier-protein) synthase
MKELIDQLRKELDLSESQALKAIQIIKEFAKKKLPVFSGAIDKLFDKYAPQQEEDFMD